MSFKHLAFNSSNNDQEIVNVRADSDAGAGNGQDRAPDVAAAQASASASAGAAAAVVSGSGDGGSSTVSVDGEEKAAAGAAGIYITTSDDTCMGSSSVGGQGDAFGFSVGSSWTDANCIALKNARELKAHGYHKAAKARLCMDEDNAMAFELAGDPCPRQLPSTRAAIAKILAADAGHAAAAAPAVQLAALAAVPAESRAHAAAPSAPAEAGGTLLAMAQSVVQGIAAAFSAAAPLDDLSNPYPFDGPE